MIDSSLLKGPGSMMADMLNSQQMEAEGEALK
jgi:hypothetical protein